jgi:hypothetical protein
MKESPTNKDLFNHLYSELKSEQEYFLKFTLAATGTLLLIVGWFLTSENGQRFISSLKSKVYIVDFIILVTYITEVLLSYVMYKKSKNISKQLFELDYLPKEYYDFKIISLNIFFLIVTGHFFLYSFLIFILHNI